MANLIANLENKILHHGQPGYGQGGPYGGGGYPPQGGGAGGGGMIGQLIMEGERIFHINPQG